MPNAQDAGVLQALNGPGFGGPAVERIGWALTASGPALLVSLVGAPIVVAVNLDLADDEVAIGGPDAGGTRRLFRGVNNGDGTNQLETKPTAGATGGQGQVLITAASTAILAASAARRGFFVSNTGTRDVDLFLGTPAGAFGTGFRLPVQTDPQPIYIPYRGAITAIRGAAGLDGTLTFAEVLD